MKVHELMAALAECDPEAEIKIAHIRNSGPNFKTEIYPSEPISQSYTGDGEGTEHYIIVTHYN